MIINPYYVGAVLDPDAQAFLTAAAITNVTITNAINQLCLDLKSNNLWNKLKAAYPFVGGTATTHKWNLKNPLDTDAAFRLTFSGGWFHSSNGAQGNGVNTNANTHVLGGTHIVKGNAGFGEYSTTQSLNVSAFGIDSAFHIHLRYSDNNTYYRICDGSGYATNNGTSKGLFHAYSNPTNSSTAYFNGTLKGTFTGATNISALNLYFGGSFNVFGGDDRNLAFAFVSDGFNNTEASNIYTIIQTFNTSLSRQA